MAVNVSHLTVGSHDARTQGNRRVGILDRTTQRLLRALEIFGMHEVHAHALALDTEDVL